MTENFITHIPVNQARNVKDLDIPLSKDKRQHLIITGKNGSGKTSLLLDSYSQILEDYNSSPKDFVTFKGEVVTYEDEPVYSNSPERTNYEKIISAFGGTEIDILSENKFSYHDFLFLFFSSKRESKIELPNGIKKINLSKTKPFVVGVGKAGDIVGGTQSAPHLSHQFLQYLVNLKADRSFARDEGLLEEADKIDEWFTNFESKYSLYPLLKKI